MAARLIIDWTPIEAPDEAEPIERATWASLTIALDAGDGERLVLTRVSDRFAKVERNAVYGPLAPLCEWIARSWSHLAHPILVGRR